MAAVCLFCSASSKLDQAYIDAATTWGQACAAEGWNLVFGGGRVGLMGAAADAALAYGSKVTGVIPQDLQDREIAHQGVTKLIVTQTMHERQQTMMDLSDAFVILPGGLGTLAEFSEVLTWKQLGYHDKCIVLVNTRGYWDYFLTMMDVMARENFMHRTDQALFTISDSVYDCVRQLKTVL